MLLIAVPAAGMETAHAQASSGCPWVGSSAPIEQRVDDVLSRMTQDEKLAMLQGTADPAKLQFTSAVYSGIVAAIPRLCIPQLNLVDGPAGTGSSLTGVTQLPDPTALAASWDPRLANSYGQVIGAEDRAKGANVALGPSMDVVRDPRAGRAFEELGEDPYLTSQLAAPEIQGVQSQGVIAQAKHLGVYNQETFRSTRLDNAIVDERTMQEIYLPAFEAAVTKGDVGSIMCSYNYINDVQACDNTYLLTQVLKGQFGFPGFVTADWYAMDASVAAANAGLDMQMPDSCFFGPRLKQAVSAGSVSTARLDDMVRRILRAEFRFGLLDRPATGSPAAVVTTPQHAALARTVAENGTVLLKNTRNLLPLAAATTHSIAVIGAAAGAGVVGSGGGSAHVIAPSIVTPYEGIAARAGNGVHVGFDDGRDRGRAASLAARSDVAIVFVAVHEKESQDLANISLAESDNNLIEQVAAANPNTVVVLNTGSAVTMPWLHAVQGVFAAWYPGQQYGDAIAALLFGDTNPSGKLPVTFPTSLEQVPAHTAQQFPGQWGKAEYSEGLNVGYRWYDAKNLTPLFPFGYGLSYTSFSLHNLVIHPASSPDGDVFVDVDVTNTGSRSGTDVAQLYLSHPAKDGEPPRSLQGFQKVRLDPGQTTAVRFVLAPRAFSHWDTAQHQWLASAGDYTISVGDSSRDLPLSGSVLRSATTATSSSTPPPPANAPTGGDNLVDSALNVLTCPLDVVLPGPVNGVLFGVIGIPEGAQAQQPPSSPPSGLG